MKLIWEHTLEAMQLLVGVLIHAWQTPVEIWLPIASSTLVLFGVYRLVAGVAPIVFRRRNDARDIPVKINTSADSDIVYMNTVTMDRFFGNARPEVIELQSDEKLVRVNLARRNRNTLDEDWIEVSAELFRTLFPKDDVPESIPDSDSVEQIDPKKWRLEVRQFAAKGIAGFWFEPKTRLRFQNRFAVYLSVGLMFFQMLLEFGFRG